jgi:hypothetical protein
MSVPETMEDRTCMYRLWVHETLRVFGDRLCDAGDIRWLESELVDVVNTHLQTTWADMFSNIAMALVNKPTCPLLFRESEKESEREREKKEIERRRKREIKKKGGEREWEREIEIKEGT